MSMPMLYETKVQTPPIRRSYKVVQSLSSLVVWLLSAKDSENITDYAHILQLRT
jgi:hypothetical protein